MRHIVQLTATFMVDDAKMIDWESPEQLVSDQLKKIDTPQAPIICSSIVGKVHPEDQRRHDTWEEIKAKYVKKSST